MLIIKSKKYFDTHLKSSRNAYGPLRYRGQVRTKCVDKHLFEKSPQAIKIERRKSIKRQITFVMFLMFFLLLSACKKEIINSQWADKSMKIDGACRIGRPDFYLMMNGTFYSGISIESCSFHFFLYKYLSKFRQKAITLNYSL
mgnify:CR=1 FL=1